MADGITVDIDTLLIGHPIRIFLLPVFYTIEGNYNGQDETYIYLDRMQINKSDVFCTLESFYVISWPLRLLADRFKYYNLCLTSVRTDGLTIRYIPEDVIDWALCMAAVQNNGEALQYIPLNYRTTDLCLEAVHNNALALQHVPKVLCNMEMFTTALLQRPTILTDIPPEYIDYKICKQLVYYWALYIHFIPECFRTRELCLRAVSKLGHCLEWVPDQYKDGEMCLAAVKGNNMGVYPFLPLINRTERVLWYCERNLDYPRRLWASRVIRRWVLKYILRPKSHLTNISMYISIGY